jgi:hypothetical protein
MSVNGANWNPHDVVFMKVHDRNFKRVVTKQNRVYWFYLTALHTWEKVTDPKWFSQLETVRRNLQNGI